MFELIPMERRMANFDPFRMMADMERNFFGQPSTRAVSAFRTDVSDIGDAYKLEAELPGFKKEDISIDIKDELSKKLQEFASYTDSLEEVFENREQIEISRFYERLPKPVSIATQEFCEDKLYYRRPEELAARQREDNNSGAADEALEAK